MAECHPSSTAPVIEARRGHNALLAMTERGPASLPHLRHLRILVGPLRPLWILVLIIGALWLRCGPVPERPVPWAGLVEQWNAHTCGPAAVATVLNTYGKGWSRVELEHECRVGPGGCSMSDLQRVCGRHGLAAEGLRAVSPSALRRVPRPFIAYLRPGGHTGQPARAVSEPSGHFVVVCAWSGSRFQVFDPTLGQQWS